MYRIGVYEARLRSDLDSHALKFVFSIGSALLIIGVCLTDSWTAAPWRWRPIVGLGLVSYSFYLVHQNLIYYFGQFFQKAVHLNNPYELLFLSLTLGFAVVLGLALIFYRFIERPTTEIGRLRSRREPRHPLPESSGRRGTAAGD